MRMNRTATAERTQMRLRLNLYAQRKREKPPDIVVDITEMLCDKLKGENQ